MTDRFMLAVLALLATLAACGNPGGDASNEELITTVTLTFSPATGAAITAEFNDNDGDGGDPPTVDPVNLTAGMYALTVGFENRLESPPEVITDEILHEAVDHQVFFVTTGPLAHAYADADANGLPIGITNTVDATAGTGQLTITLRHMPAVNGQPVKDGTTMSGTIDATATFTVTVP